MMLFIINHYNTRNVQQHSYYQFQYFRSVSECKMVLMISEE